MKKINRKIGVIAWFVMILLQVGNLPAQTKPAVQKLELRPCRLAGWAEDVRCGKYEVYENRQTKSGRKLSLRVVVAPAEGENPQPDPVFYLAGGPGGSAVDTLTRSGKSYLGYLRRERDLVFIDQRGTGESNPLACNLYADKNDMPGYFSDVFSLEKLRACKAELEKKADLKLYTTTDAVEDLDEVRAALGYEKINLYGGSYGSTAALVYLRQYSQHVRTATISGVAPPDAKIPLPIAKGVQKAVEHVFADCAADERCRAEFPDLKGDLDKIIKRLDREPALFDAVNPFTREIQHIEIKRSVFGEFLRTMLYDTEYARWLPLVLHHAANDDFSLFATISFQSFSGIESLINRGMHFSVVCSEDMPFITDADIKRETAGFFYSDYRIQRYREVCRNWTYTKTSASFIQPVKSDIPVLLISGEADPVTPFWLGREAAAQLSQARQIIIPHAGHSINSPCVNQLIENFVRSGNAQNPDVSCVSKIAPPVFISEKMITNDQKPAAKSDEQVWQGLLDTGAAKLRIVIYLYKGKDGKPAARLASPDQGSGEIPVDVMKLSDNVLHFEVNLIGGAYDGQFSADSSEIRGQWQQGGKSRPLNFKIQQK